MQCSKRIRGMIERGGPLFALSLASVVAGERRALIHLKPVRLDWSRPSHDFIDYKLGEVFRRSALERNDCDPELMEAAFNRRSINCLARCVVELLDDL